MNRWMANIFSVIFNIAHLIAFFALLVFLADARESQSFGITDGFGVFLAFLAISAGYILFVGVVSTLLSINETLQSIENLLGGSEKAKPNKSPTSMGGSNMPTTPDDIWNSPKVDSDDKKKK